MKLLVLDAATEACSVSLYIDGQVSSHFELCPQQHSQRILPIVDELLVSNNCLVSELDYLGFGRGPGSFTGVRIATGIIQGLSLGIDCNVVGVSTLAAMAQEAISVHHAQRVAVAIDARMDEVYFGLYENREGKAVLVGEECVLPPEKVLPLLGDTPLYFAGTGWQAYQGLMPLIQEQGSVEVLYPNAEFMLPLALADIEKGVAVAVEDIMPVYLRDKVTWKKLPGKE